MSMGPCNKGWRIFLKLHDAKGVLKIVELGFEMPYLPVEGLFMKYNGISYKVRYTEMFVDYHKIEVVLDKYDC